MKYLTNIFINYKKPLLLITFLLGLILAYSWCYSGLMKKRCEIKKKNMEVVIYTAKIYVNAQKETFLLKQKISLFDSIWFNSYIIDLLN